MIGTCDHGKEVEIACANCAVYRISVQAMKLLLIESQDRKTLYSFLSKRSPLDHMIVIGTSFNDLTYEYVSFERLMVAKVHAW